MKFHILWSLCPYFLPNLRLLIISSKSLDANWNIHFFGICFYCLYHVVIAHIFLPLFMLLFVIIRQILHTKQESKLYVMLLLPDRALLFPVRAHKVRSWSSQSAGTELDPGHRRLSSGLVSV